MTIDPTRNPESVSLAVQRFRFLAEVTAQRRTVVRELRDYGPMNSKVLSLAELERVPGIDVHLRAKTDSDSEFLAGDSGLILRIPRVQVPEPPERPAVLEGWTMGPLDDPQKLPVLADTYQGVVATDPDTGAASTRPPLADHPEVQEAFDTWSGQWRAWAEESREKTLVRDWYRKLYDMRLAMQNDGDTNEVVVATALLTWKAPSASVRRHLLTSPARFELDKKTGTLQLSLVDPLRVNVEWDMIPLEDIADSKAREVAVQSAQEFEVSVVDPVAVKTTASKVVHMLSSSGRYLEDDTLTIAQNEAPTVSYSPAVIIRPRRDHVMEEAFREIAAKIEQSGEVPSGLLPMIDQDFKPPVTQNPAPGAVIRSDDSMYAPLPLNEKQEMIIDAVDRNAQVLVQGPPGTGKTHTAAALITHLLAQGSRILVTAETERALREVRGKLPEAIRELAVSSLGGSQEDTAELSASIATISGRLEGHHASETHSRIERLEADVETLREERASLVNSIVSIRQAETTEHVIAGISGTLSHIAQKLVDEGSALDWVRNYVPAERGPCPLTSAQADRWAKLVQRPQIRESGWLLPAEEDLAVPRPLEVEQLFAAMSAERSGIVPPDHPVRASLVAMSDEQLQSWSPRLQQLEVDYSSLMHVKEWVRDAVTEILRGDAPLWESRMDSVRHKLQEVKEALPHAGAQPITWQGSRDDLRPQLAAFAAQMEGREPLRTGPDGFPKAGVFTNRWVKDYDALFRAVRIGGLPPISLDAVRTVQWRFHVEDLLDSLAAAWPKTVGLPDEDTPEEIIAWHESQLAHMVHAVEFGRSVQQASHDLNLAQLPDIAWAADGSLTSISQAVASEHFTRTLATLTTNRESMSHRIKTVANRTGCPHAESLHAAFLAEDPDAYAVAHAAFVVAWQDQRDRQELAEIEASMEQHVPDFVASVRADSFDNPADSEEGQSAAAHTALRIRQLPRAWAWLEGLDAISAATRTDINALQEQVSGVESSIRDKIIDIAELRSWNHELSRLTGKKRSQLTDYTQLRRRLGKGTGKSATRVRAAIRQQLQQCMDAVPVWIMPFSAVVEQFEMRENLFDVVIVDEASQADMSACLLQYLAPRMVVIGDDQQVSPAAVGRKDDVMVQLARDFLQDDPRKDLWSDPQRSLFDEAKSVFGAPITLVEHRRCVPEIINFSNRICYEPEKIRLLPVRQPAVDRLRPFETVYLADAVQLGAAATARNDAEVEALVEQVKRCDEDPRYDGKTFGVIALLGDTQIKQLTLRLGEELTPEQWEARELRVGKAPAFQGSERDVIFLSTVAVPGQRAMQSLTAKMYKQRFNVAVSRAKDQVWLFHSYTLRDTPNKGDMRRELLEYATSIESTFGDDGMLTGISDDVRDEHFDSLFEQRVFNRIAAHGARVMPQYEQLGYRIDLVVEGRKGRLAVECDGDVWHGPEHFEKDLLRQRNLERAGWVFHRIRESAFYSDQAGELERLYAAIDEYAGTPMAAEGSGGGNLDPEQPLNDDVVVDVTGPLSVVPAAQGSSQSALSRRRMDSNPLIEG